MSKETAPSEMTFIDYTLYRTGDTFQLDEELTIDKISNSEWKEGDTLTLSVENGRTTFRKI